MTVLPLRSGSMTDHVPGYRLVEQVSPRVWRAERDSDDALVAVKIIDDVVAAEREWRYGTAVRHPHVAAATDLIRLPSSAALAVSWCAGGTLAELLVARRRLAWSESLTVLIPIADALAAAHEQGIVHGDISCRNIMFDADGRPLLIDFGAACTSADADPPVAGTPAHVAPELVRGQAPQPAADLFSLGSVALMCLTGEPAWTADSFDDVTVAVTSGYWPEIPDTMAPAALVTLVRKLLLAAAEERGSAADVAAALRSVGDPTPVDLRRPDPEDAAAVLGAAATIVLDGAPRPPAVQAGPPAESLFDCDEQSGADADSGADAAPSDRPDVDDGSDPPVRSGAPRHRAAAPRRWSLRGAVAAMVAAALVVGSAVLGWMGGASPPAASALPPPSESAASSLIRETVVSPPPSENAPAARTSISPGPAVPTSQIGWLALIRDLDAARSVALVERNAELLTQVYAPGSEAWAHDRARIEQFLASDQRVSGAHRIIDTAVLLGEDDAGAQVRITERLPAYQVIGAGGTVVGHTLATPETHSVVYLTKTSRGVLIERIERN